MTPRPPSFRPDAPRIGRKAGLRPTAQGADVETDAYGAFILRAIRAYGRRVGDGVGITRQAAMARWPLARGARRAGGQPAHLR